MEGSGGMAPIFFDGRDAGSGPVTEEISCSPVTTAINNISARHMHDISNSMPDNRIAIRAWRQQIQDCMKRGHAQLFKFLLNGPEPDILKKAGDTISKYSKATWNFAASVRDLSLDNDCSDVRTGLEAELGHPITVLAELQKRVNQAYTRGAVAVCDAEERLNEKLHRVDAADRCVGQLLELTHTPALDAAKAPVQAYLESVYTAADLQTEYATLIRAYKRFATLKSLVSLGSIQQTPAPTCTICMTKEVTHVTLPCGHTYCEDCSRTQVTSCYICRVQVRDRVRLFFA
jgi:hypothetical protein